MVGLVYFETKKGTIDAFLTYKLPNGEYIVLVNPELFDNQPGPNDVLKINMSNFAMSIFETKAFIVSEYGTCRLVYRSIVFDTPDFEFLLALVPLLVIPIVKRRK